MAPQWAGVCGLRAFLTLFAVSNKIYWGNTGIELPLPAKLLELCGIFRSSGRMFYLVAACMVVYAVYTLRDRLPGRYAVLVLALFVGVQAFDLSAAAQQKGGRSSPTPSTPQW